MKCFFVYFCFVRLPLAMRGGREEMYEGTKRWPRMELGGRSFLGTLSKSLRVVLRLDPCWGLVKGRENCSQLWKAWNMFGADENKLYMETFHAHSVISKSLEKFSCAAQANGNATPLHWGMKSQQFMHSEFVRVAVLCVINMFKRLALGGFWTCYQNRLTWAK